MTGPFVQSRRRLPKTLALLAALCATALAGGCGEAEEGARLPDADTARTEVPAPDTSGRDSTVAASDTVVAAAWTAGITETEAPGSLRLATLRAVRTGAHADFDRVVFELAGDSLPGYHVEYIDEPVRQCGSGSVVPLTGDGWLEVRLSPAQAHTEAGEPTVTERERAPGLSVLKELKLTCDFEGVVTWVLGLSSPNRYRVQRLRDPLRLVVDVRRR